MSHKIKINGIEYSIYENPIPSWNKNDKYLKGLGISFNVYVDGLSDTPVSQEELKTQFKKFCAIIKQAWTNQIFQKYSQRVQISESLQDLIASAKD
jgi:hypothetical protein